MDDDVDELLSELPVVGEVDDVLEELADDVLLLDELDLDDVDEEEDTPATVDVDELEDVSVELLDSSSDHKILSLSDVAPTFGCAVLV